MEKYACDALGNEIGVGDTIQRVYDNIAYHCKVVEVLENNKIRCTHPSFPEGTVFIGEGVTLL